MRFRLARISSRMAAASRCACIQFGPIGVGGDDTRTTTTTSIIVVVVAAVAGGRWEGKFIIFWAIGFRIGIICGAAVIVFGNRDQFNIGAES